LDLKPRRIEWPPEQVTLTNVHQVTGRQISAEVAAVVHDLALAGLKREDLEIGVVEVGYDIVCGKQDGLAIRQDLWPAVCHFALIGWFRQKVGWPSAFGNAGQSVRDLQRGDDGSVLSPTAATPDGSIA